MDRVAQDVRGLIGNTPMVRLSRLDLPAEVELYAKLEVMNPGGSVKDRIGLEMIDQAERAGRLSPGGTIVEPTAGNTGVGLALAAVGRGYRIIFTMPEKFNGEKAELMRALGAEVILTPTAAGMIGAIDKAREIAAGIPGSYVPNQFENQSNVAAHYKTTGPEIWRDLGGRVDLFVAGVGTGGTFTGAARYLREQNPRLATIAVEPVGSTIGGGPKGSYAVEGIGNWFVPATMDPGLADRFVQVSDRDAFDMVRTLARRAGLLVGSSSGAACVAAVQAAQGAPPGTRIAVIFPDSAERYLSKRIFSHLVD